MHVLVQVGNSTEILRPQQVTALGGLGSYNAVMKLGKTKFLVLITQ